MTPKPRLYFLSADVRRFRPSLLIDAASRMPFPEQGWIGNRLKIGSVVIDAQMTCPRCVMTTRAFADLLAGAAEIPVTVCGKPSASAFETAAADMGLRPRDCAMIAQSGGARMTRDEIMQTAIAHWRAHYRRKVAGWTEQQMLAQAGFAQPKRFFSSLFWCAWIAFKA